MIGYIIENITGKSYAKNLKTRIVKPLNLKSTYYGNKTKTCQNEAFSYKYYGEWTKELETDMSVPHGAGAVVSTTLDMVKFIEGLFKFKLISKQNIDVITEMTNGYGLGIFKSPYLEKYSYGHTGGIDGFASSLGYFPNEKVTISFSSNGINYRMNNIMLGILALYFEEDYTFPDLKEVII